jgi:23S rRNA pseudouridine1911/1915/1917 synthase
LKGQKTKKVTRREDGLRFDKAAAVLFDMTKSQAQRLIKCGKLRLNGETIRAKEKVVKSDTLIILFDQKNNWQIPVIYEDADILAINKPSGISSHPTTVNDEETTIEVLARDRKIYLVHRLDKGTSGVMLFAKSIKAQKFLRDKFKKREIEKKYIALVWGRLIPTEGSIDIPVVREKGKIIPSDAGKEARTDYRVKKYYKNYSLLELTPKSGRTHQIRVHLSSIGNPIVGDKRYGAKTVDGLDRIFLHAKSVSFIRQKGENKHFEAPLPQELESFLLKIK